MSNVVLLYGQTNSSKTSQLADFHEWCVTKKGLSPGYHATIDTSFEPMMDAVNAGHVRVWDINFESSPATAHLAGRDSRGLSPLACLHYISMGYFPKDTGPDGIRKSNDWIQVNALQKTCLTIEGLGMFGEAILRYMQNTQGLQTVSFTESSGIQVGQAHLNAYNLVQTQVMQSVKKSLSIEAPYVIWTSHEMKGEDATNGSTALGPANISKKGINRIPSLFTHSFRIRPFEITGSDGKKQTIRFMHTDSHLDELTQLMWPCKTSLTPMRSARLREAQAKLGLGGGIPVVLRPDGRLEGGLKMFFEIIEKE